MANVANTKRNIGATGQTVASNLRRLRESQNLTYAAVVKKLDGIGHPLLPLSLRRIEEGDRSVDADDLVALAIAYDVSPHRLLMPVAASEDAPVTITGAPEMPADRVRGWLGARNSLRDNDPDSNEEFLWLMNSNEDWVEMGDLRPDLTLGLDPKSLAGFRAALTEAQRKLALGLKPKSLATLQAARTQAAEAQREQGSTNGND